MIRVLYTKNCLKLLINKLKIICINSFIDYFNIRVIFELDIELTITIIRIIVLSLYWAPILFFHLKKFTILLMI